MVSLHKSSRIQLYKRNYLLMIFKHHYLITYKLYEKISKRDLDPQGLMRIKLHSILIFSILSLFSPLISVHNENSILMQASFYNFIILA